MLKEYIFLLVFSYNVLAFANNICKPEFIRDTYTNLTQSNDDLYGFILLPDEPVLEDLTLDFPNNATWPKNKLVWRHAAFKSLSDTAHFMESNAPMGLTTISNTIAEILYAKTDNFQYALYHAVMANEFLHTRFKNDPDFVVKHIAYTVAHDIVLFNILTTQDAMILFAVDTASFFVEHNIAAPVVLFLSSILSSQKDSLPMKAIRIVQQFAFFYQLKYAKNEHKFAMHAMRVHGKGRLILKFFQGFGHTIEVAEAVYFETPLETTNDNTESTWYETLLRNASYLGAHLGTLWLKPYTPGKWQEFAAILQQSLVVEGFFDHYYGHHKSYVDTTAFQLIESGVRIAFIYRQLGAKQAAYHAAISAVFVTVPAMAKSLLSALAGTFTHTVPQTMWQFCKSYLQGLADYDVITKSTDLGQFTIEAGKAFYDWFGDIYWVAKGSDALYQLEISPLLNTTLPNKAENASNLLGF